MHALRDSPTPTASLETSWTNTDRYNLSVPKYGVIMADFGACHGRNHQIFILKLIVLLFLVQLSSNSFS